MLKRIGFIGSGLINKTIAKLALDAGYKVGISNSRGPETLKELVSELGDNAIALTSEETNKFGDIIIVSVPFSQIENLPTKGSANKIVIDTNNYYPMRDGNIEKLDKRELTSSELVQAHYADSFVVKALYNLDMLHLKNRPNDINHRWAIPMAGDNKEANNIIGEFINSLGFDYVDIGSLSDSWRIETDTPIYVNPYVGHMPKNLTEEEAMDWYEQDNEAIVTKEDVLKLTNQAIKNQVVGGNPDNLSSAWSNWLAYRNKN